MNRSTLQLALREMQGVFTSGLSLAALGIAILVLTISGPFGTFSQLVLWQRALYWLCLVVPSYVLAQGAMTLALEVLRPLIADRWPRVIVAGLLAALPVTLVVIVVNAIAYGHIGAADPFRIWLYATIITLAIAVVLVLSTDRMRAAASGAVAAPAAVPGPPPILERVPLPQRARLLALVVEDHYVDIVTERGKTLVLMRLADAIRETGDVAGLQIHRSHWVARDAVTRAHRAGGKLSLELSNGMRLPVSRGYQAAVREAGFLP